MGKKINKFGISFIIHINWIEFMFGENFDIEILTFNMDHKVSIIKKTILYVIFIVPL